MKKSIIFVALMGAMSSSYALDSTVDARSLGMGGAGVASSNGLNAVYQNPSILAGLPKEKFTLEPAFSVRLLDAGDLKNNLNALNAAAQNMSNALNAFSAPGANQQANAGAAGAAIANFSNAFAKVSGQSLAGGFYGGSNLAKPNPDLGWALKFDVRSELGAKVNYAAADQAAINTISADLVSCGNGLAASCNAAANQTSGGKLNNLVSTFGVRGAIIGELGVSVAKHMENWGGMDVGITPKFMRVTSFDVNSSIQSGNANATSTSGNQKTDSAINVDLGASKQYRNEQGHDVRAGVIVKNLFPKTLKTGAGNAIEIAPQFTTGGSYSTDWFTGTADLDVIKNKAIITGITKDSQFLRMGVELDAKSWAQLRLGYRHDLTGNYAGLPSVGLGLNLKVVNVNLSLAAAGKKEVAASIQVGTHF